MRSVCLGRSFSWHKVSLQPRWGAEAEKTWLVPNSVFLSAASPSELCFRKLIYCLFFNLQFNKRAEPYQTLLDFVYLCRHGGTCVAMEIWPPPTRWVWTSKIQETEAKISSSWAHESWGLRRCIYIQTEPFDSQLPSIIFCVSAITARSD